MKSPQTTAGTVIWMPKMVIRFASDQARQLSEAIENEITAASIVNPICGLHTQEIIKHELEFCIEPKSTRTADSIEIYIANINRKWMGLFTVAEHMHRKEKSPLWQIQENGRFFGIHGTKHYPTAKTPKMSKTSEPREVKTCKTQYAENIKYGKVNVLFRAVWILAFEF